MTTRINARLSGPLAAFVDSMVGAEGFYETPSEYIRDLIRRDMERRAARTQRDAITEDCQGLADGQVFPSSNDFDADMIAFERLGLNGWK